MNPGSPPSLSLWGQPGHLGVRAPGQRAPRRGTSVEGGGGGSPPVSQEPSRGLRELGDRPRPRGGQPGGRGPDAERRDSGEEGGPTRTQSSASSQAISWGPAAIPPRLPPPCGCLGPGLGHRQVLCLQVNPRGKTCPLIPPQSLSQLLPGGSH